MDFTQCFESSKRILMEGALGERLKKEYGLAFDENIAMAGFVYDENARNALKELWSGYANAAYRHGLPFMAFTCTRRANIERVEKSRFTKDVIKDNFVFLRSVLDQCPGVNYAGGQMGCRGDAYTGVGALEEERAAEFHSWQAGEFAKAGADFLYAGIMPTRPEAAGMARAMEKTGLPYIISFTIQAGGMLIDGTPIADAIAYIDAKVTRRPLCYMTNCVHPRIVYKALSQTFNRNDIVRERFLGIQANTCPLSYAELEGGGELPYSEPEALAGDMLKLLELQDIKLFGGCCGTDDRYMEVIAQRLA